MFVSHIWGDESCSEGEKNVALPGGLVEGFRSWMTWAVGWLLRPR